MATYVNDLRLTELATGEGSGTWGTTTNTNLELIGEALGYGTQDCFATDADATTTVADGASDPARAMYFKVTSTATLTATRTLTIAPNTMTRVMLIENATTGSQSIAISQGSGGNVTIANGAVKMVYLDGAGAGAAVVDALADLELGTITVANLTATTADINGGTIDGATLGGSSQVTITDADMNGGTIDGTVIGAATPAAGSFTTGQFGTSLNVDGTVTADGLTVDTGNSAKISLDADNAIGQTWVVKSNTGTNYPLTLNVSGGGYAGTKFKVDRLCNVSFYEDTGTTPKFFWDASAESLGIGEASPARALDVVSSQDYQLQLSNGSSLGHYELGRNAATGAFHFYGNQSGDIAYVFDGADGERMRIDSSGNLLVGTTTIRPDNGTGNTGIQLDPSGSLRVGRAGDCMILNRQSTDGAIVYFRKDGTDVGSINAHVGDLSIGTGDVRLKFSDSGSKVSPRGNTDLARDGAIDLGGSSDRFRNLYLSGGVYLGGTGAANLLDDYEEGTWTPVIDSETAGSGRVTSVNSAKYTKVGNQVFVQCYITMSTLGTGGSGTWVVRGLPFTAFSGAYYSAITVGWCVDLNSNLTTVGAYTKPNDTYIYMNGTSSASADPLNNLSFATYVKATTSFIMSGCYHTA